MKFRQILNEQAQPASKKELKEIIEERDRLFDGSLLDDNPPTWHVK